MMMSIPHVDMDNPKTVTQVDNVSSRLQKLNINLGLLYGLLNQVEIKIVGPRPIDTNLKENNKPENIDECLRIIEMQFKNLMELTNNINTKL